MSLYVNGYTIEEIAQKTLKREMKRIRAQLKLHDISEKQKLVLQLKLAKLKEHYSRLKH